MKPRPSIPIVLFLLPIVAGFLHAQTVLADDAGPLDSSPRITIKAKGSTDWLLGLVGKDLRFFGKRTVSQEDQKLPNIPLAGGRMRVSFGFVQDGRRLRLYVDKILRARAPDQAAAHGWFLGADYSTKPPSVILTKELSKYSEWTIDDSEHQHGSKDVRKCYIRNDNDLGKKAWLDFGATGTYYRPRRETRMAILSSSKNTEFEISDPLDGR